MVITPPNNVFILSARQNVLQSQSGTNLHLVLVSLISNGNKGYVRSAGVNYLWSGPKRAMKIVHPRECIPCATEVLFWASDKKNCERNFQSRYSTSMVSWRQQRLKCQFSVLIASYVFEVSIENFEVHQVDITCWWFVFILAETHTQEYITDSLCDFISSGKVIKIPCAI